MGVGLIPDAAEKTGMFGHLQHWFNQTTVELGHKQAASPKTFIFETQCSCLPVSCYKENDKCVIVLTCMSHDIIFIYI